MLDNICKDLSIVILDKLQTQKIFIIFKRDMDTWKYEM